MIHNILVYTHDGKILYSWEKKANSLGFTNKILIPGFFSAINSVVSDIFQGRIQRIEFENKTIVLSGKELVSDLKSKWILMSITVDTVDSSSLIDNLTLKIWKHILERIDSNYDKMTKYNELDSELDNLIRHKTFDRTTNKLIISSITVFISILITSFIYSFIRFYKGTLDSTNIPSFVLAITIGGFFLILSSILAGSKVKSTVVGTIFSLIGSLFSFYLIENILSNNNFLGGLGNLFIFLTFCTLLGCFCGYIGGSIVDYEFLN